MARRKETRGSCAYCGREMSKTGLSMHFKTCSARKSAIEGAYQNDGPSLPLYHLLVQDKWSGEFWLHLEMRGNATLQALDDYLRSIWLECCGHLSAFYIGRSRYTQLFDDGWSMGDEQSMDIPIREILNDGMSIKYEYDFGTTSQLTIKVGDIRMGKPITAHPMFLMARNEMPKVSCIECDEEAKWLCMNCLYSEAGCELCDEHSESHPCGMEDYALPLVNSPRRGMCGYTGPASPPY